MNQNEFLPLRDRGAKGTSSNGEIPAGIAETMQPWPREEAAANPEGHPEPSFGDRLRASRERHGLSLHDCARALRLPARLLRKLEDDDYKGIDYSVYLHGYLRRYAGHVRLDRAYVESHLESLVMRKPELVVMHTQSAWKHVVQRYSNALTYIVLTAVIVVPLIWLGLSGVLKRDIARLQPLNATPVGTPADTTVSALPPGIAANANTPKPGVPGDAAARASMPEPSRGQKPLMASIAPFSAMQYPVRAHVAPVNPVPVVPAAGDTRLTLSLQQPSWVEITDTSGKRLEYALLPAGTQRAYSSGQALNVRIGNAQGARIDVDGKPVVLDRFRHANVAHFDVGANGTVQPDNS